jgi:SAM-dependent methyltransferase
MNTLDYSVSREDAIRRLFDTAGLCLEIGPSYNPIVPKRAGFRVETVDHCDAAALRDKYATQPGVDAAKIEDVDHVWRGEPLADLVGPGRFDVVVASHVIEHTPDMLGFLKECERALAPGGRLVLAVPDRRRTFDFFRPASTTGAVLQAHHEKRTRHAPGAAFDFIANFCTFDGRQGTGVAAPPTFAISNPVQDAGSGFSSYATGADYHDCHAWVFTPSSFRLIASDLAAIGAVALREEGFWETPIFEFVTILSREAAGCPLDRADLLVAAHREAAEPAAPAPARVTT